MEMVNSSPEEGIIPSPRKLGEESEGGGGSFHFQEGEEIKIAERGNKKEGRGR